VGSVGYELKERISGSDVFAAAGWVRCGLERLVRGAGDQDGGWRCGGSPDLEKLSGRFP
jgi:hypothetical protein